MSMLNLLRYLAVGCVMVLATMTPSSSTDKLLQEEVARASDATPDAKPQLVIEAGGHRGLIRELLFTDDGRELISVSDDKTVRVWTVSADGRHVVLERTIRGHMDNGRAGMLAAAALSPANVKGEQQWLAVGGFLAGSPSYRHAIRLHDYASGEVRALLQGHTDLVLALAFSPSGRWLASAAKDNTVRLWDLSSLEQQQVTKAPLVLSEHTDHIYDLAWSPSGDRLASASYDQTVGLWATEELNQEKVRFIGRLRGHQNQVTTVAFHPREAVFASGGKDQTIRLWDAQDGHSLGTFAKTAQQVAALAFSPDGEQLLAGRIGGADTPKQITLFAYPSGSQQHVFTGHQNIVLATAFHPNGHWIASGGGEQKELILWDATTGAPLSRRQGGGATIWAVAFSQDSQVLSWGHVFAGDSATSRGPLEHRFDLSTLQRLQGRLTSSEAVQGQDHVGPLRLVAERSGPLNYPSRLDLWRQEQGSRTKLHTFVRDADHGYRHSAYTFTPDGQYVLSGGLNGSLSLYTLEGDVRAHLKGHTGEIKALTVSTDGQWALSGGTDQTLRLWSLSTLPASGTVTLMPALSLFPTQDEEWIAWTPEGFFASSTNGSQLLGYSLNQGLDKLAQYISVDQLYDRFYRPDRVFEKLQQPTLKREGALHEVDKILSSGLPPQVEFVSPLPTSMSEQRTINVQVMVKDQGGGIGKVVWKIDGITVAVDNDNSVFASRQLSLDPALPAQKVLELSKQITRSEVPSTITVVAYNRSNDIASTPALLALEGDPLLSASAALTVSTPEAALPRPSTALPSASPANGAPLPSAAAEGPARPDLYLIVVGVSRYRDRALWLNHAVSDAQALANTVCSVASPLFQSIIIKQVFNEQSTLAGLDAAFKEIAARAKPDDVFVLYLAGHGITQEGRYYFLPQDFRYRHADSVRQEAINQDHLQHWLAGIQARKSLVLIDTCESGSFSQFQAKLQARSVAEKTAIAKLTRATGRATIVASTDVQLALEGIEGHGVFTYVLLQALRQADTTLGNGDGLNSFFELAQYIDDRVPKITMDAFGYEQVPQISMVGSDFPIGVVQAPEQCAHCCERY